jgi:Putative auto-transporter adhesin, head GIN domain
MRTTRIGMGLAILVALATTSACDVDLTDESNAVKGSGKQQTETRDLAEFTAIRLEGSLDVVARTGPVQPTEVTADDNLLDLIVTKVSDGVLVVSSKKGYQTENPVTVTVQAPRVDQITLAGSGDLSLETEGASQVSATLTGSGDVVLDGSVETATLTLEGSGDITAENLTAETTTASLIGSGSIDVGVTNTLDAEVRGSGDITYSGSPDLTENITGSGDIYPR